MTVWIVMSGHDEGSACCQGVFARKESAMREAKALCTATKPTIHQSREGGELYVWRECSCGDWVSVEECEVQP